MLMSDASDFFHVGLRMAHVVGDLDRARKLIATAFLIDDRAINFWMGPLPEPQAESGLLLLDCELVCKLYTKQYFFIF